MQIPLKCHGVQSALSLSTSAAAIESEFYGFRRAPFRREWTTCDLGDVPSTAFVPLPRTSGWWKRGAFSVGPPRLIP